ncbi:DNA/RNA non-specific endonuclease [Kitasatospora sp. NPDC002551]|uniref:DNA/RNA non-specific endonuclease n=1 Tax=Kitasatospora sp. NPDC002551 TaxID=3154539 RepID=UPI00332FBFA2
MLITPRPPHTALRTALAHRLRSAARLGLAGLAIAALAVPAPPQAAAAPALPAYAPAINPPGCPQYPQPPPFTYHDPGSGFDYTVDALGRPIHALNSATVRTGGDIRNDACTRAVGNIMGTINGRPAGGQGWHGGHLVADILHGPSERYNLVPMTVNFNTGLYKSFENVASLCLNTGHVTVDRYEVEVSYPATPPATDFPSRYHLRMHLTGNNGHQEDIDMILPWNPTDADKEAATEILTAARDNLAC